uniref:Peptidase M16 N-terminal domain-containing protein n=1 Tax=Timema shepardi TaxID=629360 RepID=A0A7R9B9J1_TIMSH|nr:unnamed protein product [Timema shepardi]
MAPVDISPAKCSSGSFDQICSFKANDLIPVHKYKSNVTGIRVVVAEVEGPVVNGYFCLATEAHDDDGLPHTLEHLIFLGSESYPFKGVLDLLANRCLASGTNAWTDTDHTCYTMTTAGKVHHVTGEGEDAGVVYCEMQGRENTGESLSYLALLRAMYPGHCGYKSETGGVMKNLRESCNNTKVRGNEYSLSLPTHPPVHLTNITFAISEEDLDQGLRKVCGEYSIASLLLHSNNEQSATHKAIPLFDS